MSKKTEKNVDEDHGSGIWCYSIEFCTCNGNFAVHTLFSSIFSHRIRYFEKRQAEVF